VPNKLTWLGLIVASALLGTAWIFHSRETSAGPTSLATAPHVGSLAPEFTLLSPSGEPFTLSNYTTGSETPVVLNFWATWCPPCRIEMPFFDEVARQYEDRVIIVGLNQAESAAVINGFAEQNDLTYTLLVDQDMKVNNLYGVLNLPTTIFIDKNGIVREVLIGTISQAVLVDRVDSLLDD
jgi:thiol-disulfide isomerase/thioredoxin